MPDDLYFDDDTTGLQSTVTGLSGTPTAPLPFLDGVVVRAFVLNRPEGNVIIYNAPGISAAADAIRAMGQPQRLLMNHHHEAMYGAPDIDVPIWIHEADRPRVNLPVAGTFSERHKIADDLEVIPTPGHTSGTTAFLWDNGETRFLFPGDSLWVQGGVWKAVLLGDSDRTAYLDSLTRLKEVEFDVLVPWGVETGEPYGYAVTRAEANGHLDSIIARLEAGETA
ncbi:MAG: MBL fold metallo-hydrolase [Pseudomonadota bacterium]|nr:MBL fold metallo-hydrolase [Pseudomonadota bacterium]